MSSKIVLNWFEVSGGTRPCVRCSRTYFVSDGEDTMRLLRDLSELRKNHHVFGVYAASNGIDINL